MKKYMEEALKEAKKAAAMGEIPIGAVVVKDGEIIGRGHNETETGCDPTAHAEIVAIRQAAKRLGGWKLPVASEQRRGSEVKLPAVSLIVKSIENDNFPGNF